MQETKPSKTLWLSLRPPLYKRSRSCHLLRALRKLKWLFNNIGTIIYFRIVIFYLLRWRKKPLRNNGQAAATTRWQLHPRVSNRLLLFHHRRMRRSRWKNNSSSSLTTTGTRKRKKTKRQLGSPLITASKSRLRTGRTPNPTLINNTIVTLILRHQTKSKNSMPIKEKMIPSRRYGIDPDEIQQERILVSFIDWLNLFLNRKQYNFW